MLSSSGPLTDMKLIPDSFATAWNQNMKVNKWECI